MDYALNIVSKCRFFFIFKHLRAPKRSWKISHGGPGKSWIFLSVKEWEPGMQFVCKQGLTGKTRLQNDALHVDAEVKSNLLTHPEI